MSRAKQGYRSWRTGVLVAGVLAQLGLGVSGRLYAQSPRDAFNPPAISSQSDIKSEVRAKLRDGRAKLSQGDLDAAQAAADEVAKSGLTFNYNEDSPAKLMVDIEKTRQDPRAMLKAARSALERKDYDQAEKCARAAEKSASLFSFGAWADSPTKVLKDIEAARSAEPQASSAAKTPTTTAAKEDIVRGLVKQARTAMANQNFAQAHKHANEAAAMNVKLGWWDDTPEKVLADLQRLDGSATPADTSLKAEAGNLPAVSTAAKHYPTPRTKSEAVKLLAESRKALNDGNIEEAAAMAQRCKAATGLTWGLFEDTPDSVHRDVAKARTKRDREEAARLLVEGRRLLAKGDHEGASRCAYKSQTLFNGYSAWDLGDRPSKLLADCQATKMRVGTMPTAPSPVVRAEKQPPLPGTMPNTPSPNLTAMTNPPPGVSVPKGSSEATDKLHAQQLVAEAMRLQREGKLVEAKAKATEAMNLKVSFSPDEMSPSLVYQQIATEARQRVETMTRESKELVGRGLDASVATTRLKEARALAAAFGHDTGSIDHEMQQLGGTRSDAMPAGGPPGTGAPITTVAHRPEGMPELPGLPGTSGMPSLPGVSTAAGPAPASGMGSQLLDNARMEIRKGELATARRMVEEALAGNHGVQDQAMDLLRTIDAEEFNQKRLTANRTFDAAESAYRRREYGQAQAMFASLDIKLLDAGRLARLREINLTPEMSPSTLPKSQPGTAVVSDQKPGSGLQPVNGEEPALPPTLAQGDNPGKATVTDTTPDLQDEYKQRQTALFQLMRSKSLDAMTQAGEKFRTGQLATALEILEEYLGEVRDSKLDETQLSMLRRPVEARLSQYRLVKAQKDMVAGQVAARNAPMERVKASKQAEELKKKNVAELMRQYNTKFQAKDMAGALAIAQRAHDLDPDNPVITAALSIAQRQSSLDEYNKTKKSREEMGRVVLNDAEYQPGADAIKTGVSFDKERWEEVKKREPFGPQRVGRVGVKERAIESKLLTPVNLNFENTPLKQVIDDLRDLHALNIYLDTPALQSQGTALDSPITIRLDQVSLKSALNLILHQVKLTYVIKDEVLQITTEENAKGKLVTVTYQVADLVVPMEQHTPNIPGMAPNNNNNPIDYTPTPSTVGPSLMGGSPVGSPNGPFSGSTAEQGTVTKKQVGNTQEEHLIRIIQTAIAPKSWSEVGGAGTIEFYPISYGLIVHQTPDIQEQVQDLLQALRRLQDQSVSIEVRLITVTEDFFERIGVNFAMNILTDKQNRSFEPQLLNGNFVSDPSRFINAFNPKRFIAGLTPAGTLTPTLDIPISQQSFYQTFPTFGNYTGGGLNVGLAFLSDIQVFLMLEALQGDTRSNVMQAPKITCANGQSASIQIFSQQQLLTGVQVVGLPGGQFAFQPQFTPSPDGGSVILTVQPLITDDRRFVRISAPLFLANTSPGPIPVFPLVVPLFTSLDGIQTGQPVVFTQYIQQPRVTFLQVQTEVRIPDGGTVVLGGLKRMAEARTEFGPPVLSKIPYVNRLFKNVGYGKETESLLIMISARIIVLAEEQERATGFREQTNEQNP